MTSDPNVSTAPNIIISGHEIEKSYPTAGLPLHVLLWVSIEIERGEFVAIVGPSGNGKSTLLNCLSGLDDIDSGTVLIDGVNLADLSRRERAAHRAKNMGFVFQSFNLIGVLSAVENVELPLLAAGEKPAKARARSMDLLARVGLSTRGNHRPAQLSGGEQQRVAVARSLVTSPAVIWADEPTGNLDSSTAADVVELFCEVNATGQTIVMVTHDLQLAQRADRIVTVVNGRIAADQKRPPQQPAQIPT